MFIVLVIVKSNCHFYSFLIKCSMCRLAAGRRIQASDATD